MPIDLVRAEAPSRYPAHGPRLLPWLGVWLLCCAVGAAIVLLVWPSDRPARGDGFWLLIAIVPNGLFAVLLGTARAIYETAYLDALYRNQHRQTWLLERVAYAQRPLQILASAYYLPLGDRALAQTIIDSKSLIKRQSPRGGSGVISHTRLPEAEPMDLDCLQNDAGSTTAPAADSQPASTAEDGFSDVLSRVLEPLTQTLRTLSQRGDVYAPAVWLLTSDLGKVQVRMQQLREVLVSSGLPALECEAIPPADGLMLADAWLDARERRPLLVVAAEWYEMPPPDSTEGGVALLLNRSDSPIPESLSVIGALHRPVAATLGGLGDGLSMAVLWGKANAAAVRHAWISGLGAEHDAALSHACGEASLTNIADQKAQRLPDRIIGHAGSAAGWLSVAAALESGEAGPQLIVNQTRTVQSAVLYTHPQPTHDN